MSKIIAPFTDAQVSALNAWQRWGSAPPFTCPNHSDVHLEARTAGWRCPIGDCGYVQDWAHDFMVAAKYCTKEHPRRADAAPTEYWIHVDAEGSVPDYDGSDVPFRCPHCGLDFTVEI